MQQEIVWRSEHRASFGFGIAFVCSGALICIVALTEPTVYGGFVAGALIVLFGAWIIWHPRRLAHRAKTALAGAIISIDTEEWLPGKVATCTLVLMPSQSVRIVGWTFSLSLMDPGDQEAEEYRGAIGCVEYRSSFEPEVLQSNQQTTLIATVNIPAFLKQLDDDKSESCIWRVTVGVHTSVPRSKLFSNTIENTSSLDSEVKGAP